MNQNQVIVKLSQFSETSSQISPVMGRVVGLIDAQNFSKLMDVMSIDSNPRQPKESSVTKEICDTLKENSDRFHLMSKGILVSTSSCEFLDRSRFKLSFNHNGYAQPGILDGGHNTFAIAKYILSFIVDELVLRSIKNWETLLESWKQNIDEISSMFQGMDAHERKSLFGFLIPIEMVYPQNDLDEEGLLTWGDFHRDITHARNNNAQLSDSTKDNHQGFYDYLKEVLPTSLRDKVEWKTNDGGFIKAADLVALALIPLSKLDKVHVPQNIDLSKIYNSKQYCVEMFRQVIESKGEMKGVTFELKDPSIKAAIRLVPQIIKAYDYLYSQFPDIYNSNNGKFGRIEGVRKFDVEQAKSNSKKYAKKPFKTKFYEKDCNYSYADGFIIPLIVGLRELIEVDGANIRWIIDPVDFIDKHLGKNLVMYNTIIKAFDYNPQKIGKDQGSYSIAAGEIKMSLSSIRK